MNGARTNSIHTYWAELDDLRQDCAGKWVIFRGGHLLVHVERPKFFDRHGQAQEFIRIMRLKGAVAKLVPV